MTATQNPNDNPRETTMSSNEIVKTGPSVPAYFQPAVLGAQMEYAKALAASSLLPRQYQGQPANLLWAISYGQTLGVDPMTAVQSIHVINGKPTASADLIAGLVRRAGHKLRISGDDRKAVAQIVRADDPEFTFESVWTIERAQAAKLTGKDTWKAFPAAMLKARAITEVARAACSEILQGTIYTPEELGAVVDQDGNPVEAPVQPLQVVRHEEVPQAPQAESAPPRDFLGEAKRAKTASEVMALAKAARDAGAPDAYRAQMKAVYEEKLAAEQQAAEDDIPDAEVVPDAEHAAAVAEYLRVAAGAQLPEAEARREFEASYSLPLEHAAIGSVREFTEVIRKGAAA